MERKIGYSNPFPIKVPHSGTMALDHGEEEIVIEDFEVIIESVSRAARTKGISRSSSSASL